MTNNLLTPNTVKTLVSILVISLLVNFYLTTKLINYENRIKHVRGKQNANFFHALNYYSNDLDYFVNNNLQHYDAIERELQALYAHSFNLVEHARTYVMLSNNEDSELANLIWNLAVHIQDITHNLNQVEIKNNRNNLKEFSRTINEIVKLENQTRIEMLRNNKGFAEKEMYIVLSPKVEKAMGLYLFNE